MGFGLLALVAVLYTVMRHNLHDGLSTQTSKREVPPQPPLPAQQPVPPPAGDKGKPGDLNNDLDNHGIYSVSTMLTSSQTLFPPLYKPISILVNSKGMSET